MQPLFDFIPSEIKKTSMTSERQTIIKQFVDSLNLERINTKYKPLTPRSVAVMLGTIKTNSELYRFYSECMDYKNRNGSFGKRFFGGRKDKTIPTSLLAS